MKSAIAIVTSFRYENNVSIFRCDLDNWLMFHKKEFFFSFKTLRTGLDPVSNEVGYCALYIFKVIIDLRIVVLEI